MAKVGTQRGLKVRVFICLFGKAKVDCETFAPATKVIKNITRYKVVHTGPSPFQFCRIIFKSLEIAALWKLRRNGWIKSWERLGKSIHRTRPFLVRFRDQCSFLINFQSHFKERRNGGIRSD